MTNVERAERQKRLRDLRKRALQRAPILLRCPHCLHFVVGITSRRGDYISSEGTRSNLYCCWPDCPKYGKQVKAEAAVRGPAPSDGSHCCRAAIRATALRKYARAKRKISH